MVLAHKEASPTNNSTVLLASKHPVRNTTSVIIPMTLMQMNPNALLQLAQVHPTHSVFSVYLTSLSLAPALLSTILFLFLCYSSYVLGFNATSYFYSFLFYIFYSYFGFTGFAVFILVLPNYPFNSFNLCFLLLANIVHNFYF